MTARKPSTLNNDEVSLAALQKLRVIIQHAQHHSVLTKKKTGISGAQLWLVQEVAAAPGSRIGEVAARMSLKSVTVSNLLEPLISLGLICREQDTEDRRAFRLMLTPEGKKLLAKAPRPTRGILPDTLKSLEPKSLKKVDRALSVLLGAMNSARGIYAFLPLPFTL